MAVRSITVYCLLVAALLHIGAGQPGCSGNTPNTQPIFEQPPTLKAQTSKGKLFVVDEISPPLFVLHLFGTPYQMGYAHGTLLKTEILALYQDLITFVDSQVDEYMEYIPDFLKNIIANFGVEAALDATYWLTEFYTPQHFKDEMQGMADALGIDYMAVARVHMIPELIKAGCSMVGAWGEAITHTNGTLYQLRALDWTTNGPFQQYPAVIVYHPNNNNGHPFSILAWAGFAGCVTGFSSAPVGLCEKVWYSYNGTDSREGVPWHFLTRDVLQYDSDIDSALGRIASAHRTCSIYLGLGDYTDQFRAIEYSLDTIQVWDDHNFPAYKEHPLMDGIVFLDKHVQPSHNPCLGSLIEKYYGNIDAVTYKQNIVPIHQTGNMHIAIYDYAHNLMYVSNASPYVDNNYTPAYDRPFVRLNMTQQFAVSMQ